MNKSTTTGLSRIIVARRTIAASTLALMVLGCGNSAALAQSAAREDAARPADAAPTRIATLAPWPEAESLFRTDPRWRGGDCAYSVDLGSGRTLWLFGDSFITRSPTSAPARAGSRMVRNSIAIQTGLLPAAASMRFFWRTNDAGEPDDFFAPLEERWIWPGPGVRIGDHLLLFLIEIKSVPGGLGFETAGSHAILVRNPDDDPTVWRTEKITLPTNPWGITIGFGALIIEGEHLISFSPREPGDKATYALRWPLSAAAKGDLASPQWWTGTEWDDQAKPEMKPAALWGKGQTEFSVHFDPVLKQYINVSVDGFGATNIIARTSPALTGAWSHPVVLLRPPESGRAQTLVYSAKAHPHLGEGRLVVTYASNHFNFSTLVNDETLYYPHVLRAANVPDIPHTTPTTPTQATPAPQGGPATKQ